MTVSTARVFRIWLSTTRLSSLDGRRLATGRDFDPDTGQLTDSDLALLDADAAANLRTDLLHGGGCTACDGCLDGCEPHAEAGANNGSRIRGTVGRMSGQ